jgi:hypothetical protein
MKTLLIAMACVALAGCPKKDAPAAGGDPNASAEAGTTSAAAAAAAASAAAEAAKPTPVTYAGKYTVTAGTMYVPAEKDWASVKFKNDDTKLLGDGEMTLTLDPSGLVSGTTEGGPLGASVVEGQSDKGQITATVRRKDPSDEGLTGTLVATVTGDTLAGTMNLAESNAAVVRVAKLEAKKK